MVSRSNLAPVVVFHGNGPAQSRDNENQDGNLHQGQHGRRRYRAYPESTPTIRQRHTTSDRLVAH